MLDFIGIAADQLPEIREPGEPVDTSSSEAAQDLGLSRDTLVSTGVLDQAAGAVCVGNTSPGMFSENTGAALAICAPQEELRFDPNARMTIHYFALPSTYMVHTFATGGMVLRWFKDKFCQPEIEVGTMAGLPSYDLIGQKRRPSHAAPPPGAMAPEVNPKAKGVF